MKLVLFFLFIAGFGAWAQEVPPPTEVSTEAPPTDSVGVIIDPAVNLKKPLGRVKSTTEVNPESSSLNTDPDNIDPLNPLRENLKDDDEPVLEDIKQILNAPKVIKKEEKLTEVVSGDATKTETMTTTTTTTDNQTSRVKKNKVAKKNKFKKKKEVISLNPDEADLNLEKKFNETYKSYNINPTSDESWALATSKQTARLYVVQKGDTLWSISNLLFGDPNYWPKIWSLNKQGILNPHFIQPGSKIYFYMGDEDNAPTLSVGEATNTNVTSNYDNSANDKTPFKASLPNKIPKSMPLSRNEKYFVDKKPDEFRIELTEFPRFDPEYISDIVITDLPLKTEVQIQINETARFRCYDGRIIRDIKFMEKISEEYDIYEPLDQFKTKAGVLNAYRFYGYAKPYQLKNLIITSCKSLLVTDLILLPKDKIQTLRSRKISPMKTPVLIGGPNVVSQRLFVPQQIAYVDFGSTSFELGQNFNVMSQVTDSINGQIKIIDKYGSFAVVIVTDVNDVIEIGDKVIN